MRLFITMTTIPLLMASAALAQSPGADFQKADKALNRNFKQIVTRLSDDPSGKARLVRSQRAWVAFRDAECAFQSSGDDGGSAAPMIVATCRTDLTTQRTKQLRAYLNCEEGDLSCPVPSN
ncbi:MAG TPA: lysozyme inhibitor LprI family protein [Mesorhizobium sp.]|jgi:uncharacterized protein YecT (DUF1311 family)